MRSIARAFVKHALGSVGFELRRVAIEDAGTPPATVPANRHQMVVNELHGALSDLLFRDLPAWPGRTDLLGQLIGTPVSEALYIVANLRESLHLDGDVCEFGVAQGATSALLANEIRATEKGLWLFDSFEGLPRPTEKDVLINDIFNLGSMDKYAGTMASPMEMVLMRLASIDFPRNRAHVVPGFVETTLNSPSLPGRVCFSYIDLDFYEPIIVALRWLQSRVPTGGTIVVDDYGFFSSGAETAVDEFVAATKGEFEMTLPRKFAAESTPFCILRRH